MAGALIVIEISAPKVSDDALAVLVSSCTRAARGAECVLAKNASDDSPSAVAIVSLQSDDKMRVEVGVRQGDHDSWRTKDFAFLAADESLDRWRAVGFAIGTLAESNPPPAADEPPTPAPTPLPPVPPPAPVHAKRPAAKPTPGVQLFVAALGILGPGLDRGPVRIGSGVRLELAPPRTPLFFSIGGSASTRVAPDESGAAVRWFDVSAGPGIALVGPLSQSGLQLGTALFAERFDVSASTIGRSESRERWLFGVEGALGGRVEVVPDLFLIAELSAAELSAATEVSVADIGIGSAPSFRYSASFGLRVRLK